MTENEFIMPSDRSSALIDQYFENGIGESLNKKQNFNLAEDLISKISEIEGLTEKQTLLTIVAGFEIVNISKTMESALNKAERVSQVIARGNQTIQERVFDLICLSIDRTYVLHNA